MKKPLTSILVLLGSYASIQAQNSFYIKLGGGYAFPSASYIIGTNNSSIYLRETDPETGFYNPAFIDKYEAVKGSYATGATASGTIGYMFSENMGVEINASYLHGKEYTTSKTSQDIIDDEIIRGSKGRTTSEAMIMLASPSFILTTGENTLKPYLSAGVVFGFIKVNSTYRYYSTYDVGNQSEERDEKYTGGLSLGLRGALGLDIKLSQRFHVFSEVAFTSLSFYPEEKEITKYIINGEDKLPTLTETGIRTVYVKGYTRDTRDAMEDNYDPSDKPAKATRFSFGMSNIMASAGLKFSFN